MYSISHMLNLNRIDQLLSSLQRKEAYHHVVQEKLDCTAAESNEFPHMKELAQKGKSKPCPQTVSQRLPTLHSSGHRATILKSPPSVVVCLVTMAFAGFAHFVLRLFYALAIFREHSQSVTNQQGVNFIQLAHLTDTDDAKSNVARI